MVGLKKSAHSSDAFNACSSLIKNVLFSESSPSQEGIHKNSFRSVKVPSISASFLSHGAKEIVLISAFYEEIKAIAYLFRDAHPSLDTLAINLGFLKKHAGLVCNGGFEAYRPNRGLVEKLKRDLTQCMDFTYMATLLEWYGIPDKQRLELAEYIGQGETRTNMEWAIGAALHLASGQKLD
ncbi:hypothetical protein H0H93_012848 [Arthromyces matolae]|nr:hypothetical protein H0H93_012848 [Arthromyces matolae]